MAARRWLLLLAFALPFLTTSLGPLEAQTTNRFAGMFEERFSNMGKVAPIFTRPDAPTLATNMEISPPTHSEHQRGAAPVEQQGPAGILEERSPSQTQAAGSPTQPRSQS